MPGTTRAPRLRFWVVTAGVLAIAAFAGSSAYDVWRSYQQDVVTTHRELANMAKSLGEQAQGTLQLADLLVRETVAWYETERPLPDDRAKARLAARVAGLPQVREVRIIDPLGTPRFGSRMLPDDTASLSGRAYFVAHRDNAGLGVLVSEPLITQIERRSAFIMSRRLENPNGTFDGIVQAVVDLEEFQRVYEAIDLGHGSAINLLRDDGTLYVRHPPIARIVGRKFPEMITPPSDSSGLVLQTMDQQPHFVGMTRVRDFPLVLAVSRDVTTALEAWRDEAWHVAARTLILVLLGSAAILGLVYQVRRVEVGERALRKSEERYALAMEGANEGHFDWNLDAGPSFVSRKMKLLHGQSEHAPVTTREAWMKSIAIHPEDAGRLETALRDHFEGRTDRFETEYRVRLPDGQWRWLEVRGRCVRDQSGQVHRFVGSALDISARKSAEAEKRQLELQLRQSQKMEAMGTLAGGIAHDFNNILGAILGYGELAQKAVSDATSVRRYVDNVMQAGGRAKALVERILAFSRSSVGERLPVNVQAVVEETLELVTTSLSHRVRLERRLDSGDAAIVADPTQLHQVAMNLFTNALQAMEATGGVLEVVLERVDIARPRRVSHGSLNAGTYVRLCVGDTGCGIPPDILDHIFDPFFTTKGVGGGTGLGLSLVHSLVGDLGGAIDVRSIVRQGTMFTIWLPVSGEATAPMPNQNAAVELPGGHGQTVMIVDDEVSLVALSEEIIATLGYEPVSFTSGTAALRAFREEPQRFDLILTDEAMPDLGGTAMAEQMLALRPDIPVVLMSGYAGTPLQERARAAGIRELLLKPLQRRDIAEALRRVLG